jgi:hypothetical protein
MNRGNGAAGMTTVAEAHPAPSGARPFAPYHRWDRNFFLALVAFIWLGILMGFVPEMLAHARLHQPAYPLIVHVHAAVFVGWLILLTVQTLLIRRRHVGLHRRLGVLGAALAAVMVVVGPATAIVMQRVHFGTTESDPPFVAIQFTDIIAFAGLAAAAILWRHHSAAHKRLILLATLYISDAGFARWLAPGLIAHLGNGFWPTLPELYLANDTLVLALGAYDLATRRRLHPAYVAGVAWIFVNQVTAAALYQMPAWKQVALKIIGH